MEAVQELIIIGEDERQTPADLAGAEAATVVVFDQTLFEEIGGPWKKGREIGVAHGAGVVTHGGRVMWNITFWFGGADSLTATGVLPGESSSVGAGVITVTGGTGRYRKSSGEVLVEVLNPNRYRFAL